MHKSVASFYSLTFVIGNASFLSLDVVQFLLFLNFNLYKVITSYEDVLRGNVGDSKYYNTTLEATL